MNYLTPFARLFLMSVSARIAAVDANAFPIFHNFEMPLPRTLTVAPIEWIFIFIPDGAERLLALKLKTNFRLKYLLLSIFCLTMIIMTGAEKRDQILLPLGIEHGHMGRLLLHC